MKAKNFENDFIFYRFIVLRTRFPSYVKYVQDSQI